MSCSDYEPSVIYSSINVEKSKADQNSPSRSYDTFSPFGGAARLKNLDQSRITLNQIFAEHSDSKGMDEQANNSSMVEVGDVVRQADDGTTLLATMPFDSHRTNNLPDDSSCEMDKSTNFYKNDFSSFELLNVQTERDSRHAEKEKTLPLIQITPRPHQEKEGRPTERKLVKF